MIIIKDNLFCFSKILAVSHILENIQLTQNDFENSEYLFQII